MLSRQKITEACAHLVVLYENGRPQFRAGIPDEWSEADLMRHVMVEGDENNA
jgi:hypothetical protein